MGMSSSSAREDLDPIDIKVFQDRGAIKKDIDAIGIVEKHILFWEAMGYMYLDNHMTIQQLRSFPDSVQVGNHRHGIPVGKGKVIQKGTGNRKPLVNHRSFCTLCFKGYPVRVHWKITGISHFWCEVCASRFSWVNLGHYWSIVGIGEIHLAQEQIRKSKRYGTNTAIHGAIEHTRIRKWETRNGRIDDIQGTTLSQVSAKVLGGLTESKERKSGLDLTNLSSVSNQADRVDTLRVYEREERTDFRERHLWTQHNLPRVRVASGNMDLNRMKALKAHTRAALVMAMTRLNPEQLKMLAEDVGVTLSPERSESMMRIALKISPSPDKDEPEQIVPTAVVVKAETNTGKAKAITGEVKKPAPKLAKKSASKVTKPASKMIFRGSVGHVMNGTKNKFGGNPPNPKKCARTGCNYRTTGIVPNFCCEKCLKAPGPEPAHGRRCEHSLYTASLGKAAGPITGPPTKKPRLTGIPEGQDSQSSGQFPQSETVMETQDQEAVSQQGTGKPRFQGDSYKWPPGKL